MFRDKILLALLAAVPLGFADDITDVKYLISKIHASSCQLVIDDLSDDMDFMDNGTVNGVKTYLGILNKSGINNAKQIVLGCDSNDLVTSALVIMNKGADYVNYKRIVAEFGNSYTNVMSNVNKRKMVNTFVVDGNLVTISALAKDYEMSITIMGDKQVM